MRPHVELVAVVGSPSAGEKNCVASVAVDGLGGVESIPVPHGLSPDEFARSVASARLAGLDPAAPPRVEPVSTSLRPDGDLTITYLATAPHGHGPLPDGWRYVPISVAARSNASVAAALARLAVHAETSDAVLSLLPRTFTLPQVATLYESIWGTGVDRRNLRRKMVDDGRLEPVGVDSDRGTPGRPPTLYRAAPGWRAMRRPAKAVSR